MANMGAFPVLDCTCKLYCAYFVYKPGNLLLLVEDCTRPACIYNVYGQWILDLELMPYHITEVINPWLFLFMDYRPDLFSVHKIPENVASIFFFTNNSENF
jgi:hypothetical protein